MNNKKIAAWVMGVFLGGLSLYAVFGLIVISRETGHWGGYSRKLTSANVIPWNYTVDSLTIHCREPHDTIRANGVQYYYGYGIDIRYPDISDIMIDPYLDHFLSIYRDTVCLY